MLKNNILTYFKNNTAIFIQMYSDARKTADIDALHDMRVSLKRIGTLVRMLNHGKKANFRLKESFKPLKKLFRLAGPLRDFQVQLLLLEEIKQNFGIDEAIQRKFALKKDFYEKRFFLENKSFDFLVVKRNFHIIEYYLNRVAEKEIEQQIMAYEKNRKILLEVYSKNKNKLFNLHSARKMIKDLAYLIEMSNPGIISEDFKYKQYKETGHYLGDLHDNTVMLEYIKEIMHQDKRMSSENTCNLYSILLERKRMHTSKYLEKYNIMKKE